ncbi:hypothetical protein [Sulfurimonas sp. HSL-1716]|uniref:hypothetical protein n=1 Tax=Hydrocurvibacter sulfurireducens TaxID=3131937 RepID=UPI0031F77583
MSEYIELEKEVNSLKSNQDFSAFLTKYGLTKSRENDSRNETFYSGQVGEDSLHVSYRWKDPSKSFSIRPDRNFIEVHIKDVNDNVKAKFTTMYEDDM